jgi:hypothetical protein
MKTQRMHKVRREGEREDRKQGRGEEPWLFH